MAVEASILTASITCQQTSSQSNDSNEMHQFDLLYMASNMLYGIKYKYILSGIDVASRYKVSGPLRTKQVKDVADMIIYIYKVGPLTYPEVFHCDNGSELKAEMPKMFGKYGVMIQCTVTKYKHIHTPFIKALNKLFTEQLFKVQETQELNDPEKVSSTWVKHLYGLVD